MLITKPKRGIRLNPFHPLSKGLVGCWLFNEGSGQKYYDLSLYGNHGIQSTKAYAPKWTSGKYDRGLKFDGTNDFCNMGNDASLNCFPPDTLIFANSKVKPISEIALGEKVLGHKNNYQEVTRLYRRQYNGILTTLHLWNLPDIKATPNHPVLAIRTKKSPIKIGGRYITCSPNGCSLKDEKWCRKIFENYKEEWIQISELTEGDFVVFSYPNEIIDKSILKITEVLDEDEIPKRKDSVALPNKINVDNNFLRLVGYYLAEGSFDGNTIYFSFNKKEKEYIEDVQKTLKTIFNVDTKIRKENSEGINVYCCSRGLGRFFEKMLGNGSTNKKIPHWMILLPSKKQREIMKGYLRGDGHLTRKEVNCVTTSLQLAHQLRLLLYRLNVYHSFYEVKPRNINHSKQYEIQTSSLELRNIFVTEKQFIKKKHDYPQKGIIDDGKVYIPIKQISSQQYRGEVYNLEVDNSHSYNTLTSTVHNCTDAITIEAWVNAAIITGNHQILNKRLTWLSDVPFQLSQSNNFFRFEIHDGIQNTELRGDTYGKYITINTWYHIVGTFDGSYTNLFINGEYIGRTGRSNHIPTNVQHVAIGKIYGQTENFNGTIDNVRIYNRALSASEIKYSYRHPFAMFEFVDDIPDMFRYTTLKTTKELELWKDRIE